MPLNLFSGAADKNKTRLGFKSCMRIQKLSNGIVAAHIEHKSSYGKQQRMSNILPTNWVKLVGTLSKLQTIIWTWRLLNGKYLHIPLKFNGSGIFKV